MNILPCTTKEDNELAIALSGFCNRESSFPETIYVPTDIYSGLSKSVKEMAQDHLFIKLIEDKEITDFVIIGYDIN